ncbi:MAG TPA: hypothetical protein DEP47_11430 [Chloroflexi bacterium]|nr:hypothetical protein [Chloroflexota bacterium]
MLDMRLTYEDSRSNDVPLGSGVIMVFDEETDMRPILRQIGRFFAHESCGKCFPCQLGTQRQLEILDRIASNGAKPTDRQDLTDIGLTMTQTSLCGLGQTASIAIQSAMKRWPEVIQ